MREVGVAFLLAVFFVIWDPPPRLDARPARAGLFWRWRLHDGGPVVSAQDATGRGMPLKACVEISLHQVNHQIWLLKNVFWWYLLPIAAALGISTCAAFLRVQHPGRGAFIGGGAFVLFGALLYWGIYGSTSSRFARAWTRGDRSWKRCWPALMRIRNDLLPAAAGFWRTPGPRANRETFLKTDGQRAVAPGRPGDRSGGFESGDWFAPSRLLGDHAIEPLAGIGGKVGGVARVAVHPPLPFSDCQAGSVRLSLN